MYSLGLHTGEAVEIAFEAAASESRILEDAALTLQRHIKNAHLTSSDMPWPPSASDLTNTSVSTPDCLNEFLAKIDSWQAI